MTKRWIVKNADGSEAGFPTPAEAITFALAIAKPGESIKVAVVVETIFTVTRNAEDTAAGS